MASPEILHIPAQHRFETQVDGHCAILTYTLANDVMTTTHTLVPDAIANRGIGSALARAALDFAAANNLKVLPACSFIAAYIARHRQYQPLLVDE
jgi:predicted GNAT family acetyltransferase